MVSFEHTNPVPFHPAEGATESQRIVILHINDIHGRTEGIARVAMETYLIGAPSGPGGDGPVEFTA